MGNPPGWRRHRTLSLLHCHLSRVITDHVIFCFDFECLKEKGHVCMCYYLQKSWSPGPLGTGGSALKACGMGAGWRGVPCNGLKMRCNALLLRDMTSPERDTHLNTDFFFPYVNTFMWIKRSECYVTVGASLLTLRQQLTAARGHHGAVFGGLTMRTGRQLDVIATVTVHKQAGQENHKNIYNTKTRANKHNRVLTHNPTHIRQTRTQITFLFTSRAAPTNVH